MKACEFDGWLELEKDDVMVKGDRMCDSNRKDPNHPYDIVNGYAGMYKWEARGCKVYRRHDGPPPKPKLHPIQSKPLPLP